LLPLWQTRVAARSALVLDPSEHWALAYVSPTGGRRGRHRERRPPRPAAHAGRPVRSTPPVASRGARPDRRGEAQMEARRRPVARPPVRRRGRQPRQVDRGTASGARCRRAPLALCHPLVPLASLCAGCFSRWVLAVVWWPRGWRLPRQHRRDGAVLFSGHCGRRSGRWGRRPPRRFNGKGTSVLAEEVFGLTIQSLICHLSRKQCTAEEFLPSHFSPIPSMSRPVINSAKLCLSHLLSRIKWIDQWAVDPDPVLTSTSSAKIGKAVMFRAQRLTSTVRTVCIWDRKRQRNIQFLLEKQVKSAG